MIDFTNCEVNKFKAYGGANSTLKERLSPSAFMERLSTENNLNG